MSEPTRTEKELARVDTQASSSGGATAGTVAPGSIECPSCFAGCMELGGECSECRGTGMVPRCPHCADLLAALKAVAEQMESGWIANHSARAERDYQKLLTTIEATIATATGH